MIVLAQKTQGGYVTSYPDRNRESDVAVIVNFEPHKKISIFGRDYLNT